MILSSLFLLAISTQILAGPIPPFNLKCENNPVGLSLERLQNLDKRMLLGIDTPNPTLSWTIKHTDRAASQTAFQVIVYIDNTLDRFFWDSGKISSPDRNSLIYEGPTLVSGRTYFWQVVWWDHNGDKVVSEETGHFLVAILDASDWDTADWIGAGDGITTAPYIFKQFHINSSAVTKATLFLSGLGFSKPLVNGVDLNARYDPPIALTPGWTNYEKMVPYTAYDITSIVNKTDHLLIGSTLGRGWRNTDDFPFKDSSSLAESDIVERVMRVLITIHMSNSSTTRLVSDGTWKSSDTNISYDSIYGGETYGFSQPRDLISNADVRVLAGPNGTMYLPTFPYIAELAVQYPEKVYSYNDDRGFSLSQIVDFGENNAGYCQVYNGHETSFEVRHAEVAMHEPYGKADGSLYYGNLRGIEAMEAYLGGSNVTYKPSFTYHGFRYAEVTGFRSLVLTKDNIKKIVIGSNLKRTSTFHSSLPILNAIQNACIRSQQANLMSVITDCCQRNERLGWLGDAGLSAESMAMNFDTQAFFINTLNLMKFEMINGTLPDVVPYYRYGNRPADPSWSSAYPEVLYRTFQHGNFSGVMEFFKSVFENIITTAESIPNQDIAKLPYCYYGDWVQADRSHATSNNSFTGATSLLVSMKRMIEMAGKLGLEEEESTLTDLFEVLYDSYNKGFKTVKNGEEIYLDGREEAYALPIALMDTPDQSLSDGLLNSLREGPENQVYITGGIVTVRYIFPALTKIKAHDEALAIAQSTQLPSFGFMLFNPYEPSTTLWELWNSYSQGPGMNSRNHHMFSSISGWLLTDMAGLSLEKGYDEIHFHPARALGLSYASVSLENPKPVSLTWRRSGGVQCAKQVENHSPLNPNLPLIEDLTVSCGHEDGGTIAEVLFASYGNPEGHCGGYYRMGSCHAPQSIVVVEKLCLGRRSCTVPTGADFWDNSCSNSSRWLIVSVQCKSDNATLGEEEFIYSSIAVNVSVPMGSRGLLHLPTHGKQNLALFLGGNMIYSETTGLELLLHTSGVLSSRWDSNYNTMTMELASGDYGFTWKGDNPRRRLLDSRSNLNSKKLSLKCDNSSEIITSINWASYGNSDVYNIDNDNPRPTYLVGTCHTGSSKIAIERKCLGKSSCTVQADQSFFGKMACVDLLKDSHLIVEYSCGYRLDYWKARNQRV